jgi:hypothetical protein
MTDFRDRVFKAREETALKRLASRIPGIGSYMEKNMRRDADKLLTESQGDLLNVSGGLALMDDVEAVQKKLQLLGDRLRTAVYGYAGWFDAVAIREEELDALYDYDTALLVGVDRIGEGISAFNQAVMAEENVKPALAEMKSFLIELHEYVDRRRDVLMGVNPPLPLTAAPEAEIPAAPVAEETAPAPDVDEAPPAPEAEA